VVRTYRKLAKVYHPDLQRTEETKQTAQEVFLKIAAAYEVLRDNDSRKDYDYMLDNPEEMYRHYWQYYRRKISVDVRFVLAIIISIVSAIQYWAAWSKYNEAIDYFLTVPKYRYDPSICCFF
jgi:DnaJ family protein C protein 25